MCVQHIGGCSVHRWGKGGRGKQRRGGQGDRRPVLPSEIFFRGAKIGNCQCEISYKICKVQLVNKFKVVVILAFL